MINFIIPGMYEHYILNFKLLELLEEKPEFFLPDINIAAVYGNFQFNIFDGGRNFNSYRHTSKEEIEYVISQYNDRFHIPIRQVYTNTQLKPTDYYNRFGNLCLFLAENPLNELVINDDKFAEYVREYYPQYTFISSTTKCLSSPQALLEELNNPLYKMVCLDYNLNKNQALLKDQIPQELRSKCEFLVNAICPPGCPQRKQHYKLNSLYSLSYGKRYSMENCQIQQNTLHPTMVHSKNNITIEEILSDYIPLGYNLFKIEGRTLSLLENACNYVRYMVKPEYQQYVLTILLDEEE